MPPADGTLFRHSSFACSCQSSKIEDTGSCSSNCYASLFHGAHSLLAAVLVRGCVVAVTAAKPPSSGQGQRGTASSPPLAVPQTLCSMQEHVPPPALVVQDASCSLPGATAERQGSKYAPCQSFAIPAGLQ